MLAPEVYDDIHQKWYSESGDGENKDDSVTVTASRKTEI